MTWQHHRTMAPEQLGVAIHLLNMKPAGASRYIGCSDRQMRRMLKGERTIPPAVVLLIRCMLAHRVRPLVPKRVPGTY